MSSATGDGQSQGLLDLIGQTTYQAPGVTGEPGVSGGADSTASGMTGEGLSPAVQDVSVTPPATAPDPGVTPQDPAAAAANTPITAPTPPVDPALQQLQETIVNQQRYIDMTQRQIQYQQEQEFRRSLEDMDPQERELAIRDRELQRLRQQNQHLTQAQRQAQVQEQEASKRQLAYIVAMENGLPDYLYTALLAAQSPQEMEQEAARLSQNLRQQFQPIQQQAIQQTPAVQQPVQQQPSDVFVAGGEGASSDTSPKVEKGSGDLMGLISQNQYQVVQNW